jgi:hypothetical protein
MHQDNNTSKEYTTIPLNGIITISYIMLSPVCIHLMILERSKPEFKILQTETWE